MQERDSLIVGLMRMGYGHIRMGRSAVTWGERAGANVLVHDPLETNSLASTALKSLERVYSECSRLSAAIGGPAEAAWGLITRSGGASSQAASRRLARAVRRVMDGLPRDVAVVGAHPWNGHLAVACGFRRVVNLVPDAHPQAFCVVPEALNLCQTKETRAGLIELGVAPERAIVAGHWVPAELAESAPADSRARLDRLRRKAPLRLLFSIGGAGAQRGYLEDLFGRLAPHAREGRLRLIVNAGDHARLADALGNALERRGLKVEHAGARDLDAFLAKHPLAGPEPAADGVLIRTDDAPAAVEATDRLMRVSDVLATKPSELAFFPLPKLHLRRVGDHEAPSALYSSSILGDGTPEQREPADAAATVEGWLADPEGLSRLNEGVGAAAGRGVYSGSKVAVERALDRAIR